MIWEHCIQAFSTFSCTRCCTSICDQVHVYTMLLSTSTSGNQQQEGHTHSIQHGKRLGGCLTGAGRCWSATHLSNASREVPCKNHAQTQAHSQVSCRGNCLHQRALNLRGHCLDNRMLELQRSCHKHWPPLSPTSRGGNELPFEKIRKGRNGTQIHMVGAWRAFSKVWCFTSRHSPPRHVAMSSTTHLSTICPVH